MLSFNYRVVAVPCAVDEQSGDTVSYMWIILTVQEKYAEFFAGITMPDCVSLQIIPNG